MSTKSDISPGNDHNTLVTQKSETVRSIRNNHKVKEGKKKTGEDKKNIYFW